MKNDSQIKQLMQKVGFEIITDDYEIIAIDCQGGEGELTASIHDEQSRQRLYKRLMDIYAERADKHKRDKEAFLSSDADKFARRLLDWAEKKEQE